MQKLFFKKKKKTTFEQIQSYETFGPKMSHLPRTRIFFGKTIRKPCFFYSYLSTFKKSKPDVNAFIKFW